MSSYCVILCSIFSFPFSTYQTGEIKKSFSPFFVICIFDRGTLEIRTFLHLLAKGLPAQVLFFLWSTSLISVKHTLWKQQSCQDGISKGTALPPVFSAQLQGCSLVLCFAHSCGSDMFTQFVFHVLFLLSYLYIFLENSETSGWQLLPHN